MKKLYLPGTSKHIGHLTKETMHLYKRFMKYFPLTLSAHFSDMAIDVITPVILTQKDKDSESNIQLMGHGGYLYNIGTKEWIFYNCIFKTPDNLDVIEMSYLYKHWNTSNG